MEIKAINVKKLQVGIIGTGVISSLHAEGYLASDKAEIAAVCDVVEEKAKDRMKLWGAKKYYTDYHELLKNDEIDAVEILTPHHLHREMAIAAAEAGKHISIQKPMALNPKECDEMISAAKKAGVVLNVTENFLFYPPLVKMKELIDANEIGEPIIVRMESVNGASIGGWYKPVTQGEWKSAIQWRQNREKSGGGPIFDSGLHQLAVAKFLMGKVKDVEAQIADFNTDAPATIMWNYYEPKKYGSWDFATSKMRIRTKYFAIHETFEVIGEEGILWVTRCHGEMRYISPLILYKDGKTTNYESIESDWSSSFKNAVHHFIECALGNEKPKFAGEDGKNIIQFAMAIYKSAKERKSIQLEEIT
jgi:predicted dehydrogenase